MPVGMSVFLATTRLNFLALPSIYTFTNFCKKSKGMHVRQEAITQSTKMEGNFTNWSAENATKAFLETLKLVIKKPTDEPDVSEFISAIAAGNDAQLMVVTCGEDTSLTTLLALVAAAHQTGGRVVCIFRGLVEFQTTMQALGQDTTNLIEFVIGDAEGLILEEYKDADFVLNDCKLVNHEAIVRAVQVNSGRKCKGAIVLGCNAFCSSSWEWAGVRTQLLPIGEGLLVTRIAGANEMRERGKDGRRGSFGRKSKWVVKVDHHTGEEHVFRVTCPNED